MWLMAKLTSPLTEKYAYPLKGKQSTQSFDRRIKNIFLGYIISNHVLVSLLLSLLSMKVTKLIFKFVFYYMLIYILLILYHCLSLWKIEIETFLQCGLTIYVGSLLIKNIINFVWIINSYINKEFLITGIYYVRVVSIQKRCAPEVIF